MPLRGMRHRGMSFANALPLRMSPRVYDGSAGVPVVGVPLMTTRLTDSTPVDAFLA